MEACQSLHMSGAGAAMASEALDLASMMAWLGWVPQRTAGVPAMYGMYRDVCFFPRESYGARALAARGFDGAPYTRPKTRAKRVARLPD